VPRRDPRLAAVAQRLAAEGLRIRPLDLDHFTRDLRRIYAVASASFAGGVLATPATWEHFAARYRPLAPLICPDLVLLAERDEQPAGFVFAIPDLLQAQRGVAVDTVVVKTVAVQPGRAPGLGGVLVERCLEVAHDRGYHHAIAALMHEHNASRRGSARHAAQVIRRYTLYARPLPLGGRL
jgi:L-amino acid N-acyltransferase YncA